MDQETATEIKRHFDVVAEALRAEIQAVDEKAERRSGDLQVRLRSEMQSGMQDVRSGMQELRSEMRSEMQDVRSEMQSGMQDLRSEMQELRSEMRSEMQDVRSEMQELRSEMRSEMQDVRSETQSGMQDLRSEMQSGMQDLRRHFDVVAEGLRADVRIVAEGVVGLDQKFTLEFQKVREEFGEQIGDVKSLLRASYGDLDRRVQTLERKPS